MACVPALTQAEYLVDVVDQAGNPRCSFKSGKITAKFGRTLDGISSAELSISTADGCCPCIPVARVDRLRFVRKGTGEVAWIGPITRLVDDQEQGKFTIEAQDYLYWWQGAPFTKAIRALAPNETDPVTIAAEMIRQAEQYQTTGLRFAANLPPLYGTLIEQNLKEGESIFDAFSNLAKGFLDFTVVGPDFYYGGKEIPVPVGPTLRKSRDWKAGNLIVDRDATAVASQVRVVGAGGIVAVYPAADTNLGYGKRTLFIADTNLNTVAEAQALAQFVYEANNRPSDFLVTGSGSLGPNASVCLSDLIPGRKFPVVADSGCLTLEEVQRLHNVVVDLTSGVGCEGGWALKEQSVAVDLQRVGTEGSAQRVSG